MTDCMTVHNRFVSFPTFADILIEVSLLTVRVCAIIKLMMRCERLYKTYVTTRINEQIMNGRNDTETNCLQHLMCLTQIVYKLSTLRLKCVYTVSATLDCLQCVCYT